MRAFFISLLLCGVVAADETLTLSGAQVIRTISSADPSGSNSQTQATPRQALRNPITGEDRRVLVTWASFISPTQIPSGSRCTSATLSFVGAHTLLSPPEGNFHVNRPAVAWGSSTSWNSFGAPSNWNGAHGAVWPNASSVNITAMADRWTFFGEAYRGVICMVETPAGFGHQWSNIQLSLTYRVSGDSDNDGDFDQLDLVMALQGGKYNTGQSATFEQGDWNYDGKFDQFDIIHVQQGGHYGL